jgi:hypothetical protein
MKKGNTGIVLKGHVSHLILTEGGDGGLFPLDCALGNATFGFDGSSGTFSS